MYDDLVSGFSQSPKMRFRNNVFTITLNRVCTVWDSIWQPQNLEKWMGNRPTKSVLNYNSLLSHVKKETDTTSEMLYYFWNTRQWPNSKTQAILCATYHCQNPTELKYIQFMFMSLIRCYIYRKQNSYKGQQHVSIRTSTTLVQTFKTSKVWLLTALW